MKGGEIMDQEKIIHDLALLYVGKTIDKAATPESIVKAYNEATEKISATINPRKSMKINPAALLHR